MGFFITEPNRGDYLIQLKKNRNRTTEEVIDEIREKIKSTQPALTIDFGQVIGDMLGDLMSSSQPIEIKIFGNDQNILKEKANQVALLCNDVKGCADVFNGITIAGPSITVTPNYQALALFGITPAELQKQLQYQLDGSISGSIYEKEQLTPVRILYPDGARTNYEEFKNSKLFLADGRMIPLSRVANISLQDGISEIERENLQSMIPVTARLNGRDLGSVMNEIISKIKSNVNLPAGYHIEFGGAYKEQSESFNQLLLILFSAALLVFGVMLFLFKKIKIALLILFIAICGISGSIIALTITHAVLNVGSYTGLIMIIGIIGENAIFTYLQFQETLKTKSIEESIKYAISTRLRPKLMTALGAIIALLPIALGIGTGAQLHQPLAISVIGGFIIALPLLLIVYPTFLRLLIKKEEVVGI
jgi:Cu/Ag efflux pump CusA